MKIGQFLLLSMISCIFVIPTTSQPPADWPALETQKLETGRWRAPSTKVKGLDKASLKELESIRSVHDADRLR